MPTAAEQIVFRGQLDHRPARLGGNGRAEHRLDPRRSGPGDHFAAVGVELLLVEMGVGVEKHDEKLNDE